MSTLRFYSRDKGEIEFGTMRLPRRKKPALIVMRGNNIDVLGWFKDDESADRFDSMITFMVDAIGPNGGYRA